MATMIPPSRFDGSGPYPQPKRPMEDRLQRLDFQPAEPPRSRLQQHQNPRPSMDGYNAYNGNPFVDAQDYDYPPHAYDQSSMQRRPQHRMPPNRGPIPNSESDFQVRPPRDARWDQMGPQHYQNRPLNMPPLNHRPRPDHDARHFRDQQRGAPLPTRQVRPPPGWGGAHISNRPARVISPGSDVQRGRPGQPHWRGNGPPPPGAPGQRGRPQEHVRQNEYGYGDALYQNGGDVGETWRGQPKPPHARDIPASYNQQTSPPHGSTGPSIVHEQQLSQRAPLNDPTSPKMMAWDNPFPVFPSKKNEASRPAPSDIRTAQSSSQHVATDPGHRREPDDILSHETSKQDDAGYRNPARHVDDINASNCHPKPSNITGQYAGDQQQAQSLVNGFEMINNGTNNKPRDNHQLGFLQQQRHGATSPTPHLLPVHPAVDNASQRVAPHQVQKHTDAEPISMASLSAPFSPDDEFPPYDNLLALDDPSYYDEDSLTSLPRAPKVDALHLDGAADKDNSTIYEMMGDLPPTLPLRHQDHTLGRASPANSGPVELPGDAQIQKDPSKSIAFNLPSSTPSGRAINSADRPGSTSPKKTLPVVPAELPRLPAEIRLPEPPLVDRRYPSPQGRFNHERPNWNSSLVVQPTQPSPDPASSPSPMYNAVSPNSPPASWSTTSKSGTAGYNDQSARPSQALDSQYNSSRTLANPLPPLPVSLQPGPPRQYNPGPASSQQHQQQKQNQQQQYQQQRETQQSRPIPVRPGLPQPGSSQLSGPSPIRQYSDGLSLAPTRSSDQTGPERDQPPAAVSVAVTHEEIYHLRKNADARPNDLALQMKLAMRLVEAASVLATGVDMRSKNKDRERYILEAHSIVKKLAASGYTEAMFYLADCYGQGLLGLQSDPREAFNLYLAAAKAGHPAAAYRTAVCCEIGPEEGGGTRKDSQKALQWYRHAASLDNVPAMYKLGMILLKGLLGQARNPGEAVTWLKAAAKRADAENPHALHELGLLYEDPTAHIGAGAAGVAGRDEAQAFELFQRSAALGYKYSQFRVGQAYEYGMLGCGVDARSSIVWYTRAAAQGEHQSELALSGWYLTGCEGILEHSDTEAYLWARKAASSEPPLPKAMFAMGYFTETGIGCPRSLDEAKRWYGRAAAYKFPKAQERLEELKKGGNRVQKNKEGREKLSRKEGKDSDCAVM